mgnify:CR=1 FL=1
MDKTAPVWPMANWWTLYGTDELAPLQETAQRENLDIAMAGDGRIEIRCTVSAHDRTGVEMEALTAVNVALLTVYDMCKAVDRGMTITNVKLMEKHGGKSGSFVAQTKSV